jgi:predicted nucleic acid-binding protein
MSSSPILFPHAMEPATFVVDASVARTWMARRFATHYTIDVMSTLTRSTAIAPRGLVIELADEMLLHERQGYYSSTQTDAELIVLMGYPILVDDLTLPLAWGTVLSLARSHALTCRAAAYLELAIRRNLPLATIDPSLTRAAAAAGVSLYVP